MKILGKLSAERKQAIQFFADCLLSKQIQRHVSVRVLLSKDEDFLGLTHPCGYNSKDVPRDFIVEINKNQSEEELLITLAHEMCHVKQYAYKELNETMTKWRGLSVCARSLAYGDQPWEIEAETKGIELYGKLRTIQK
jgi:hypothetical protein